ncbi:unannotated protein [freshwater metagenome]|uniref:Unannotated protein n=1 Tax=freshwater metagenome TaxID=449393 RepID=A0A6J6DV79_9ZZZZ
MFPDRIRRIDRHLVVRGITMLDTEVVILEVDIEIGQDQLLLDEGPDDPRHLITIELDDGSLDFDLAHLLALPDSSLEILHICLLRTDCLSCHFERI